MSRARTLGRLTPREAEVVALVCDGLTQREIAERLGIREDGVREHVRAVSRRLQDSAATGHGGAMRAIRRAYAAGLSGSRALPPGVACPRCSTRPALRVTPALEYAAGDLPNDAPALTYACHAVYCGHVYTITAGHLQPEAARLVAALAAVTARGSPGAAYPPRSDAENERAR